MSDGQIHVPEGRDFWADFGAHQAQPAAPDDDRTPMTRTELAMLWDLLHTWQMAPSPISTVDTIDPEGWDLFSAADAIREHIDAELAERFGG